MFGASHWDELVTRGYTVVTGAVAGPRLLAAQEAAAALNARHPDGGWKIGATTLWREIHRSEHPAFLAIAAESLRSPRGRAARLGAAGRSPAARRDAAGL